MEASEMESIDLSLALKATDGDVDLLRDVVDAFLDEYPTLMAELELALKRNDAATIRRASHTIKGSLRLFGEVPSKVLAERLEEMGVSGTLENSMVTYQGLQGSLDTLRHQLLSAMQKLS